MSIYPEATKIYVVIFNTFKHSKKLYLFLFFYIGANCDIFISLQYLFYPVL